MILIIGAGLSGIAAVKLAKQKTDDEIILVDQFQFPKDYLSNLGIKTVFSISASTLLDLANKATLIIVSPGIDPNSFFSPAFKLTDKLIGELEFAYRYCNIPIWAVTGTNGKTTTVEMLVHILNHSGKQVIAAGNIGLPFSEAVLNQNLYDGIVLEISSFQLETIKDFKADLAAVINITSDHLDRYENYEAYQNTKLRLLETVSKPSHALVNSDLNKEEYINFGQSTCSLNRAHGLAKWNETELFDQTKLPFFGEHNYDNALVAAWFCIKIGITPEDISKALQTFSIGLHRMEVIENELGIMVINDSKSTNPDALIKCIESLQPFQKNIVLIAGGRDKCMNFEKTLPLVKNNIKSAILIGESAYKLNRLWKKNTPCQISNTFFEAITLALSLVRRGDILLLSPGCASQDMFKSYKDRGDQFREQILRS